VDVTYDVAIIGGGINGCGIARDAAGRGLSVYLCEQADLGSGTSSASTKLIHGGLRYLDCSQQDRDTCNGNRVDDQHRCQNRHCRLYRICDRIRLK